MIVVIRAERKHACMELGSIRWSSKEEAAAGYHQCPGQVLSECAFVRGRLIDKLVCTMVGADLQLFIIPELVLCSSSTSALL